MLALRTLLAAAIMPSHRCLPEGLLGDGARGRRYRVEWKKTEREGEERVQNVLQQVVHCTSCFSFFCRPQRSHAHWSSPCRAHWKVVGATIVTGILIGGQHLACLAKVLLTVSAHALHSTFWYPHLEQSH